MRVIEQQMINAIVNRTAWKSGNTAVKIEKDRANVYLHGNHIASIFQDNMLTWTLAGWNTRTTRSRINALANKFNGPRVSTKQGQARAEYSYYFTSVLDNEWVLSGYIHPRSGA